jgi:hypothetical protein
MGKAARRKREQREKKKLAQSFVDDLSQLAAVTGAPAELFDALGKRLEAMSPEARAELMDRIRGGIRT